MGFSRQEYWSRLPFPSLGDSGMESVSPALAGGLELHGVQAAPELDSGPVNPSPVQLA